MRFSIIIPVHNNATVILDTIERVVLRMQATKQSFEIVCVDDRSNDQSLALLHAIRQRLPLVRIVSLEHNYGQDVAFVVGLEHASGDYLIFLSADRQEEENLIDRYIEAADSRPDLIIGVRSQNKEHQSIQIFSKLFYRLVRWKIPKIPIGGYDTACISSELKDKFLLGLTTHHFIQHRLIALACTMVTVPYVKLQSTTPLRLKSILFRVVYFVKSLCKIYLGWVPLARASDYRYRVKSAIGFRDSRGTT